MPGANGDGGSWASACSLEIACQSASAGDEIWVAKGTHKVSDSDRDASFRPTSGVRLYGGFAGHETRLQDRQIQNNITVLSGDIGQAEQADDNAYTILFIQNGEGVVVDGFTFTGGMARDYVENLQPSTCGAAIFIQGGSPQIANCIFVQNFARNGGAVYINGQFGAVSPLFNNCVFRENKASFNGGAVYNNGKDGKASPIFQACTFEENKSDYGACIFNDGSNGECAPLLLNCSMSNNFSLSTGAVVYSLIKGNGKASPILENCHISGNDSVLGDDIASNRNIAFLDQAVSPTGGIRTPSSN